jgi:serine protease DegQ
MALAATLSLVLVGCGGGGSSGITGRQASASSATTQALPPAGGPGTADIPGIVDRVAPSVVTVLTKSGLGSGVVWSSDGIVVTDNHVVTGAASLDVAFADGRHAAAKVQAADPITDLAVLKVDRTGLPPATFQKGLPRVGELAIALGSPLGFENTVTAGIVSGLQRSIPGSAAQTQSLVDLIQTDAAISPGNSGGALVNERGEVIGINEAYLPPSTGAVSIGFAIPAPTVSDIVGQLLKSGSAKHAFFGIQPGEVTTEIAQQLGLGQTRGIVVLDVVPTGPAAAAGIRPGDVITAIDGTHLDTVEAFLAALRPHRPGDVVMATLVRDGKSQDVKVTLTDRPAAG